MTQPSTISEHAIEISRLVTQPLPGKAISHHYKQIQQTLQTRNKKTQVYTWTVAALQRQYQRRLCEDRLLVEKHEKEWTRLRQERQQLEQEINQYTQQIQANEDQLQAVRAYAQERQTKYLCRQRQFHQYAKIPIVSLTYKKKYLRAQAKNQQAESDVAAQRHGIDHIKEQRSALIRQLSALNQDQEEGIIRDIRDRITTYEALVKHWNQGLAYWKRMASISQSLAQAMTYPPSNTFGQLCVEYDQLENDEQWNLDGIDFDCAKCHQHVCQDQPRPDKNRPTDILCTPCYQGARTSMIIRKKLGFLQSSSSSSLASSRQSSYGHDPSPLPKDIPVNHVV